MPRVTIDLPQYAYERLTAEAIRQRRQLASEAEIRLLRSLRLPLVPARVAPARPALPAPGQEVAHATAR